MATVSFALFNLMIAVGGASFVGECTSVACGQLHQAIFAGIAGFALFAAAYLILDGAPGAARIAFLGTLPILVVHTILVSTDPNESMFFPLSSLPVPLVSGAAWLLQRR